MLYLYKNFTPNINNTQHYWYNSLTAFRNAITTYQWLYFEPDKYTINTSTIRVTANNINPNDANDVTYVIDEYAKRAYHVDACVYQSGYLIIDVRLDLWATYINDAVFSSFYVKRCNRYLSYPANNPTIVRQGYYDSIKSVNRATKVYIPKQETPVFSSNDIYFVFVADIGIKANSGGDIWDMLTNLLAGTMSSVTRLYAVPYTTDLETTTQKISGIYQITRSANLDYPVAVSRCWILPKQLLNISSSATTFTTYVNGTPSIVNAYQIYPSQIGISQTYTIDPNYDYYAGTPTKYMKIPRTTGQQAVVWVGTAGQASFNVAVEVENQVLDLSDAFEISLTYNNGSKTGTDIMAHTIKTLTGVLNSATQFNNSVTPITNAKGKVTGFSGGNALQVAQGTFASALETSKVIAEGQFGSLNTQAEGIVSYFTDAHTAQMPLGITIFRSINNEQAQANAFGASYECVFSSPDILKNCTLFTGATNTFIQAEVGITGIPIQAIDAIQNKFAGGITLIDNRT